MFNSRELATLCAALLFWKEEMCPHDPAMMQPYFATLGLERFQPLSEPEIESLSDRLVALIPPAGTA